MDEIEKKNKKTIKIRKDNVTFVIFYYVLMMLCMVECIFTFVIGNYDLSVVFKCCFVFCGFLYLSHIVIACCCLIEERNYHILLALQNTYKVKENIKKESKKSK